LKLGNLIKSGEIKKALDDLKQASLDDLISQVGFGRLSPRQVVNLFLAVDEEKKEETITEKAKKKTDQTSPMGISLTGIDDVMVKFAKCCNPIPGDQIAGYISRGRGITVHDIHCPHIKKMDGERVVDVQWSVQEKNTYPVHIKVICDDRKGVLTEVSSVISSVDINISHAQVDTKDMIATCHFVIEVRDIKQLNKIISSIKQLKFVKSIERVSKYQASQEI